MSHESRAAQCCLVAVHKEGWDHAAASTRCAVLESLCLALTREFKKAFVCLLLFITFYLRAWPMFISVIKHSCEVEGSHYYLPVCLEIEKSDYWLYPYEFGSLAQKWKQTLNILANSNHTALQIKWPTSKKLKKSLELVFWLSEVDTYSCYYQQQKISVLGIINLSLNQKKNHHKRRLIELFKLPSYILQLFLGRFIHSNLHYLSMQYYKSSWREWIMATCAFCKFQHDATEMHTGE